MDKHAAQMSLPASQSGRREVVPKRRRHRSRRTPKTPDEMMLNGEYRIAIYSHSAMETTNHPMSRVSTQIAELSALGDRRRWKVAGCYVDRATSVLSAVPKNLQDLLRFDPSAKLRRR